MSISTEYLSTTAYMPPKLVSAIRTQLDQGVKPADIYRNVTNRPPTDYDAGTRYRLDIPVANLLRAWAYWDPRP